MGRAFFCETHHSCAGLMGFSRSQTPFGNACLEALLHGHLVSNDTAGAVKACIPK